MKDRHEITFMDVRDLLIKINPISKYYPDIKHGFITAETCKKYDMAVMYTSDTLNSYTIDFMDIGAITNNPDIGLSINPGVVISTNIDLSRPYQTPFTFILDGLVVPDESDPNGYVEKCALYSTNTTLMEVYIKDIRKYYHKWRSFIFDLIQEFDVE